MAWGQAANALAVGHGPARRLLLAAAAAWGPAAKALAVGLGPFHVLGFHLLEDGDVQAMADGFPHQHEEAPDGCSPCNSRHVSLLGEEKHGYKHQH